MSVYDEMEAYDDEKHIVFTRKDYSHINFERCKDKSLTIKLTKDGRSVYAHSRYNPEREARKFVDTIDYKRDTIFMIFGFGLGHYIREFVKRASMRNFFFIYEPDPALFSKIIDEGYCNDIFENKNVYVIANDDTESFDMFAGSFISADVYRRCKPYIMPGYNELYEKEYAEFLHCVKNIYDRNEIFENTSFFKSENWVKHGYCNTKFIINGYAAIQFKDVFKGKSAVVVSAGPSLKKNIHLLKEIKGKIPIIAVFVAAKILLENGIVPDFIASVDDLQEGMDEKTYEGIPLIFSSSVPPEFIEKHKGINIIMTDSTDFYSQGIMIKSKKEMCEVHPGGSVACYCASFAQKMGCKNIILIGQDLAYTENKLHVDGTIHKEKSLDDIKERTMIKIPAIGGGEVLTDKIFLNYIDWFERFAEYIKVTEDVNLIDATEGGAVIKNTEIMTFREAIDKYCIPSDVEKTISQIIENGPLFSEEEKKKFYEDIKKEFEILDEMIEIMEEQEKLFDKYIKACKYRSATNLKGIIKQEEKLAEIDKKIEKLSKDAVLLVSCGKYISYANRLVTSMERISIDDDVYESAIRRKNWLMEKMAAMKSVKKLREEYKDVL